MAAEFFVVPYQCVVVSGLAVPGAKLTFYQTGTTTKLPIYTTSALMTERTNPVVANGAGHIPDTYLNGSLVYRVQFRDKNGTLLEDVDPYIPGETGLATGPMGPTGTITVSGIQWVTPQQFQVSSGLSLALGGGVQDDSPAFVAAITYLNSIGFSGYGYGQGTPKLFVPHGHYYMGTTTLDITHSMIIEGEQGADAGGGSTVLRWAANATGIRVQTHNTTGASGTQASAAYRGDGSIIRNLMLVGGYTASDAEYHGIHLRGRASIRDCYITNFQGDGIYANATAGSGGASEGNVNCFEFTRLIITGNRNGVYLVGADTNAGSGNLLDLMSNRAWGINDNSFLGNTWTACHTSGNASGPYRTTNVNACSVFTGCYSESDQTDASFAQRTIVVGGLHAAGVGTAAWLRADANQLVADNDFSVVGDLTVDLTARFGGSAAVWNGSSLFAYVSSGTGNFLEYGSNINFGPATASGIKSSNAATGHKPFYLYGTNLIWVYGGDGNAHWTLDNNGMDLSGVYKVSGTQVVGARGAAVADATDAASAITQLNALLARCRAHGLIAP